MTVIKISM